MEGVELVSIVGQWETVMGRRRKESCVWVTVGAEKQNPRLW